MARICIVGDSHVAALKQGWNEICNEFPSVEMTFFAAIRAALADFALCDGKLVATSALLRNRILQTSQGKTEITGDYDAYLCSGFDVSFLPAGTIFKKNWYKGGQDQNAERACDIALDAHFRQTEAAAFLLKLRRITDAPVLFIGQPYRAPERVAKWTSWCPSPETQRHLSALYATALDRTLRDLCNARFLQQPAETLDQDLPLATADRFFRGAARAYAPLDGQEDRTHTGAAYGAIVLKAALKQLEIGPENLTSAGDRATQ
ncbi:MAG: hypothetical protein JO261_00965 [Alphaproteobacteria bacterium]|nr:hypothetical protein [Alphaproteobacteria bacterium]MBV9692246.1 hypothetical protein [Alphaproteobacteria bacterium]